MNIVLALFLAALAFSNAFLIYKITKNNHDRTIKSLTMSTVATIIMLFSVIWTLFIKSRPLAFTAFTLYYIALSWLVALVLNFSLVYTQHSNVRPFKNPVIWMAVLETVAFIINYKIKYIFTLTHFTWFGHSFWITRRFNAYYVFTILILIQALIILGTLLKGSLDIAPVYRVKYISIFIAVVILCIFYGYTMVVETPFMFISTALSITQAIITYMAIYYAPNQLIHSAMLFLSDKLNDGMVLYDNEHILQFVTDSLCSSLDIKDKNQLLNEQEFWSKAINHTIEGNEVWHNSLHRTTKASQTLFYEIRHMELLDKNKPVGTVYWIVNVTDSVADFNRMQHIANFDELTNIYNERHFYDAARNVIDLNPEIEFIVTVSDIKKYRVYADRFGQDQANDILVTTAKVLRETFGKIDNAVFGRIDTDVFAALIPKSSFHEAELLHARDIISKKYTTPNYTLIIDVGAYHVTDRNLKLSTMCNHALLACSTANEYYQNKLTWFDEKIQHTMMQEERYNAELTGAINRGDIKMYLQTQLDSTGKLVGAEALVRWLHPKDGLIPPVRFIPLFERNGRIPELDLYIWQLACSKLKEWQKIGRDDLHISVNISARDLYALNIYDTYVNLIKEFGIKTSNLKLEITESAIIEDLQKHITLINRLHEAGFEVEMDDFGSAYSSFNMLKDICVDVLKIDMNFLGNTENLERSRIILESIVNLSRNLNMKTVAEGVETEEQFDFLRAAGCDIYQGYYFAKPLPVEEFEKKYGIK